MVVYEEKPEPTPTKELWICYIDLKYAEFWQNMGQQSVPW